MIITATKLYNSSSWQKLCFMKVHVNNLTLGSYLKTTNQQNRKTTTHHNNAVRGFTSLTGTRALVDVARHVAVGRQLVIVAEHIGVSNMGDLRQLTFYKWGWAMGDKSSIFVAGALSLLVKSS